MWGMPDEERDLFQLNPVYATAAFPGLQTYVKLISGGEITNPMVPCSLQSRRIFIVRGTNASVSLGWKPQLYLDLP